MCKYSLEAYDNRPAQQGEILQLQQFESGTKGFVSPSDPETAVCLLPGTKVLVASTVENFGGHLVAGTKAEFVEKHKHNAPVGADGHKDALHFEGVADPVLLQDLPEGVTIEVIEVPSDIAEGNKTETPAVESRRELVCAAD
jgi:hypothetical protein